MLYKIHTQEPWVYTILQRRMITVLYTKKQPINVTWLKIKSTNPPPPPPKKNITRIVFYDVNNNHFFKSKNSTE